MDMPASPKKTPDDQSQQKLPTDVDASNEAPNEEKPDYNWQIDANQQRPFDPLLECLLILAKLYDKPTTPERIRSGLPLLHNKLAVAIFDRAAERVGLAAKVQRLPLSHITDKALPVVMLMRDGQAAVIVKIKRGKVTMIQPESSKGKTTVKIKELEKEYAGYCIFVDLLYEFDKRADEPKKRPTKAWFWGVIVRALPVYSEVIVASLLINGFALASPLFIMNVYDRVVPNNAIETLWVLAIGAVIVFSFDFIMRNLRGYFIDTVGKKIDLKLSSKTFEQLLGLKMESHPQSVGSMVNTVQSFESFREFITSASISAIVDLPFVFLFIAVIWMLAGPVALVPLAAIPIVIGVALLLQIPMAGLVQQSFRHSAEKQAVLYESLSGVETIKSLRAESPMQRRWESIIAASAKVGVKLRVLMSLGTNFSMYAQQLTTIGVVIVGVSLISAGELTVGALIACTILTGRVLAPIIQIVGIMTRYQQSAAALHSLDSVMKLPTERPHDIKFLDRPSMEGTIEFDKVAFTYPGQPIAALNEVSFSIKKGERVAIIGASGSGKTTIEKLILKFYQPTSGNIMIDGMEINQIDPAQLRHHIGYVPQDVMLFHGTIRDNVMMGAPYVEDQLILDAVNLSGMAQFITSHPLGFDRPVGERGQNLSGGQRQALAIARALILDPPILVLDEPTNAMDDRATVDFIRALHARLADKTLIIVTHTPTMLALVDRLIIMNDGQVVADGPKEEVLKLLAEQRDARKKKDDGQETSPTA